jgi:hypothetical protein
MKRPAITTTLYVLLVFASGIAVGGSAHLLYTSNSVIASTTPRSPAEYRRQLIAEMRTRLHLTSDQVSKLEPILDETRRRYQECHKKIDPETKAIQAEQVQKIRALLTDDQQTEFEKMRAEREKNRQQSGSGF